MLCRVVLWNAALRYVGLGSAVLCCKMCSVELCCALLCCAVLYCSVLCYVMLYYAMMYLVLCCAESCCVALCYTTFCCGVSCANCCLSEHSLNVHEIVRVPVGITQLQQMSNKLPKRYKLQQQLQWPVRDKQVSALLEKFGVRVGLHV